MNTGENLKALADSIASISIGGGILDSLTGEYSFHAYMYSGSSISNISDKGRSLTITQPAGAPSADGSNSDFSDYLLSYTYYVSDGDTRPLVELRMVHATSSVERTSSSPQERLKPGCSGQACRECAIRRHIP